MDASLARSSCDDTSFFSYVPVEVEMSSYCNMYYGGSSSAVADMSSCCKSADVISYADGCGLYCLAEGQSLDELQDCLKGTSAGMSGFGCSGFGSPSATITATASQTLAKGASIVATATGTDGAPTASSSSTTNDNNNTASSGNSTSGSGNSTSAAPGMGPSGLGLTLSGMTMSALLISSVVFGALQL